MFNSQQKSVNSNVIVFDVQQMVEPSPSMFTVQCLQSKNVLTGQTIGRGTTYFLQHNRNEYV